MYGSCICEYVLCVRVRNEEKVCELRRKRQPPRHCRHLERKGETESDSESDEVREGVALVVRLPCTWKNHFSDFPDPFPIEFIKCD